MIVKHNRYSSVLPQLVLAVLGMLSMLASGVARGHALDQSYLYLDMNQKLLQGRIEITISDLNRALSLNLPVDSDLSPTELGVYANEITSYFDRKVSLAADGRIATFRGGDLDLMSIGKAQYLLLPFTLDVSPQDLEFLNVTYKVLFDVDPAHRGFLIVENNWKTGTFDNEGGISLVFSPENSTQRLDLRSSTVFRGFLEMVKLGMHHIWDGIDHLLFLLALLLPSVVRRSHGAWVPVDDFRSSLIYVVKIVTLFTVAHTITLSAATLGAVSLSSRLVESIIAISIAIAALDILWPVFRGRIWFIVFAFGLFHGFGFASVLSSIGIPPDYVTHSLLAFNIGVELGQIAIVSVAFPILYVMRSYRSYRPLLLKSGAICLIVVSMYWFVERAFLIDLPAGEYLNRVQHSLGLQA